MSKYYFNKVKDGLSTAIVFDIEVYFQKLPFTDAQFKFSLGTIFFNSDSEKIKERELEFIKKGLMRIKHLIHIEDDAALIIDITDAYWLWVDYQDELWELAIVEWTSKEFNFEIPPYDLEISKVTIPYHWKVLWD